MRKRIGWTASLLTGAIAAFVVATALGSAGTDASHVQATTPHVTPQRAAIDPRLTDQFAIFRRSRVPGDALGSADAGISTIEQLGVAADLTRRLNPPGSTRQVWVAPTRDGACFLPLVRGADGVAASCSSVEELLRGEAVSATGYGPRDFDIGGLVPDDVTKVQLRFDNGDAQSVTVGDNAYDVHTDRSPTTVELTMADGTTRKVNGPGGGD